MSMQMITRFGDSQEPVDGFESLMCLCVVVVNAEGRRVGDENIEGTSIVEAVKDEARQQSERAQVGVRLGILIRSVGSILDTSAQAAEQECFDAHDFQVQVRAALRERLGIVPLICRVMVARHVKKRDIQEGDDVFEIGVGKVSAPNDQFDILEMTVIAETVETFDNLVTNSQYLHRICILP